MLSFFGRSGVCVAAAGLFGSLLAGSAAYAAPAPIVLTGADRRSAMSLDGEWATIVDPYFSGLFSFHHEEKKNGFFMNYKAKPGDPFPTEYDFGKAPKRPLPLHGFCRDRVSGVLVDGNGPWIDRMRLSQGLAEKALGGRCIPLG